MKIIGIMGKAGCGKTTLSNIISEKTGASVIHLDYILDDIKKTNIMKGITETSKHTGDRVINVKLSDFLYKSPIIRKPYLLIRNLIKSKILNKKIQENQKENQQFIIVEGIDINDLDIKNGLDFTIKIETPYYKRINRIAERDGIFDKDFIVHRDKKSSQRIKNEKEPDIVVENIGTLDELECTADQIISIIKEKEISSAEYYRRKMKFKGKLDSKNKNRGRINETEKIYEDR